MSSLPRILVFSLVASQGIVGSEAYGEHCGKVPSMEEMSLVLRTTSLTILACLPVVEKYSMKLNVLFNIASVSCECYDRCFKDGIFVGKNVDDPGAQCYLHELRKILVEDFPADQRDEAARDVFGCHANLDKMSKAEVFSVMHWMLSLAP